MENISVRSAWSITNSKWLVWWSRNEEEVMLALWKRDFERKLQK